jgi:hypothetical protein
MFETARDYIKGRRLYSLAANELVISWYVPRSLAQLVERRGNSRWSRKSKAVLCLTYRITVTELIFYQFREAKNEMYNYT